MKKKKKEEKGGYLYFSDTLSLIFLTERFEIRERIVRLAKLRGRTSSGGRIVLYKTKINGTESWASSMQTVSTNGKTGYRLGKLMGREERNVERGENRVSFL